jgi:SAM-dependent methyltransferase
VSGAEERIADDPTSELWGEHRARYAFALRHQLTGQTVLDVACGSGFGLRMLSATRARAIGIDYDRRTLVKIRAEDARLVQADATRLPLPPASIDQVVSFETLEHVPDARALVHELRRVLKPGGRLMLSTPNRAFGPPQLHTGNPFHIREFTADELRALLQECFDEVQLFGQRPRPEYRYVPFLMVEPRYEPTALVWKALVRLPFSVRNALALALSGRPFYPSEHDYCFDLEATDSSHVLVAVAR